MKKKNAVLIGGISLLVAVGCQLFNDLACYDRTLREAIGLLWFTGLPLVPGLFALFTANPLRAIGAAATAIPLYWMALTVDCILPYQGGGASFMYATVVIYGLPFSIFSVWYTGYLCKKSHIKIC